ncbi:MAG: acetyl/propionyl/methylcrotonyl-CoA carboxylase subunit alpha [Hylemonella sp.]
MFEKILIANRGEIACRVAATARRLGIRTVAVYSDADAQARHVALCDEAVAIGGLTPADSYLRGERIIEAALAAGAQAIHPGYGFLSENEGFARACAAAGLVFIGPPPAAIEAMGLKAESKRLMERAGVPLVPGYHGAEQDPRLLQHEADRIGYPVLIKASAGGGGRGLRIVEKPEDFAEALASCQREAQASFGDAAVLIEKYVLSPRHIEIQVFGDTQGHYVHLFERDCSVQRRHQKVLEEAPAPGLSPQLRQRMGQAAIDAARAVGYVGAGTVEFIVEQREGRMDFFFMEMNTRLQVEHPVTEAITGLDLVEWQLRVAAGEPLPLTQEQIRLQGHAIEARICAENPEQHFLPATGTLQTFTLPPCSEFSPAAVRVDAGVRAGDAISPYYDSMVAKLIVHGDTREQALARLDAALAATRIVGVHTNVQFLRRVLASPSFAQARLDTALIAREAAVLFGQEPVGLPLAAAAVVAHTLQQEQAMGCAPGRWTDPWGRRNGWRAWGLAQRRFELVFHGERQAAVLTYLHDGALRLAVAGQELALRWQPQGEALALELDGRRHLVHVVRSGEQAHVFASQGATQITVVDALAHAADHGGEGGRLTAPMPGKVLAFAVQPGERVRKGQVLAVLEAMKMEHTIAAPDDGVVAELLYAPGEQVSEGAELLRLSAA